jgi:uracil-DNA glycosylase
MIHFVTEPKSISRKGKICVEYLPLVRDQEFYLETSFPSHKSPREKVIALKISPAEGEEHSFREVATSEKMREELETFGLSPTPSFLFRGFIPDWASLGSISWVSTPSSRRLLPRDYLEMLMEDKKLLDFIDRELDGERTFPSKENIFRALWMHPQDIKVLIIGQDPYHSLNSDGEPVAIGYAFAVSEGSPIPPSLRNIFKEVERERDLGLFNESGDPSRSDGERLPPLDKTLFRWIQQGVLLLNTTLTVEQGKAGSHSKLGIWKEFMSKVFRYIHRHASPDMVIMAWGNHARTVALREFGSSKPRRLILESCHPSPLGTGGDILFEGNNHFSKCNEHLQRKGQSSISWMSRDDSVLI